MFSILLTLQKDHIRDATLGKTCVCINNQHKYMIMYRLYFIAIQPHTLPNLTLLRSWHQLVGK